MKYLISFWFVFLFGCASASAQSLYTIDFPSTNTRTKNSFYIVGELAIGENGVVYGELFWKLDSAALQAVGSQAVSGTLVNGKCQLDVARQYDPRKVLYLQHYKLIFDKNNLLRGAMWDPSITVQSIVGHYTTKSISQDEWAKRSANKFKLMADRLEPAKAPQQPAGCISGNCDNGIGTYRANGRDGSTYTGQFKNGRANGNGKIVLDTKESFEGIFENGGGKQGVYTNPQTGERLEGVFGATYDLADIVSGRGTRLIGTSLYKGTWKDREFISGSATAATGEIYTGEFYLGTKQGYGEEYLNGKLQRKGYWIYGYYRPVSNLKRLDLKTEPGLAVLLDEYLQNTFNGKNEALYGYKPGTLHDLAITERSNSGNPKTVRANFDYQDHSMVNLKVRPSWVSITFNENMLPIYSHFEGTFKEETSPKYLHEKIVNAVASGKVLFTKEEIAAIEKSYVTAKTAEIYATTNLGAMIERMKKYPSLSTYKGCLVADKIEGMGMGLVTKEHNAYSRGDAEPDKVRQTELDFVTREIAAFKNKCSKDVYIKGIACTYDLKTDKYSYEEITNVLRPGVTIPEIEIWSKFYPLIPGRQYFYNF